MTDEKIPILCYHRVHPDHELETLPKDEEYCGHVSVSEFQRQMDHLEEAGVSVITHEELYRWVTGRMDVSLPAVVIHFDDNRLNVIENAYPILKARGWTATVFVVSGLADGGESCPHMKRYPWMGWDELSELQKAGWIIGAHTRNHYRLSEPKYSQRVVRDELVRGRNDIAEHLGLVPTHFAYPAGMYNLRIESVVRELFQSCRLWTYVPPWHYNQRSMDPYRLEAINPAFPRWN